MFEIFPIFPVSSLVLKWGKGSSERGWLEAEITRLHVQEQISYYSHYIIMTSLNLTRLLI